MKEINIKINDIDTLVKVQRYFTNEDGSYLIYSQDESDADGNVKIYVTKVIDNNHVVAINTPEEWDKVKKTIVGIINDNKECTKLSIEDLDSKVLNNLEITEVRALRLPSAVIQYLSANQPEFSTIELNENEKELETKTESLKNMNDELNSMLNEIQMPTVSPEDPTSVEQQPLENKEESAEEKMGATMEIIMPTKQVVNENVEHPKKKKGKFSFKSLFGIKDEEEATKEVNEPAIENSQSTTEQPTTVDMPNTLGNQSLEPVAETDDSLDNQIVNKSELPEPTPLNPIVVENNVEEPVSDTLQSASVEPIIPEPIIPVQATEEVKEEPTNDNSGFDFFTNLENSTVDKDVENEVNNNVETTSEPVSKMEVLTLEEDLKYKKLYEESEYKIKELESKIFEMEKSIEIYEAKLKEIKNITQ